MKAHVSPYHTFLTKKEAAKDQSNAEKEMKDILASCSAVNHTKHGNLLIAGQRSFFLRWQIVDSDICKPQDINLFLSENDLTFDELTTLIHQQNVAYRFKIAMAVFSWVMKLVADGSVQGVADFKNKAMRMKFWKTQMDPSSKYPCPNVRIPGSNCSSS